MKKWIKRIGFTLLGLMLLIGVLFFIFYNRFVIVAPEISYSQPKNTKEAQFQDLDYLKKYAYLDRSFDTESKQIAFIDQVIELENKLPLSKSEFEMEVAKCVAIAGNSHTNVDPRSRAKRLNMVPLRFYWFAEGLHVVMADIIYEELLGARVAMINGIDPEDLLALLKPYYGGSQNRLKFFSPLYFSSPELLNAIGLGTSKDTLHLILGKNEEEIAFSISSSKNNKDTPGYWTPNWINPENPSLDENWRQLSGGNHLAFKSSYKNITHKFFEKGLYIQFNENADDKQRPVNQYLNEILEISQSKRMDYLVLDLRYNPGGDYHLGKKFIESISNKYKEMKCYLLIGNGTFSAGIMTAAIAKHAFGERCIIVGEQVGDKLQFWADGGSIMRLPNSRIPLRIWTAYHDWQNGCSDWNKCFWFTIFNGVAVDNLSPDIKISLRIEDYKNNNDTQLNTVLNISSN